jgi:hypothetical protein
VPGLGTTMYPCWVQPLHPWKGWLRVHGRGVSHGRWERIARDKRLPLAPRADQGSVDTPSRSGSERRMQTIRLLLVVLTVSLCGDESTRPLPKLEIRRQGLHPHPGPEESKLASVWDYPYWEECGWTPPVADWPTAKDSGKRTAASSENKAVDFLGGTAEWRSRMCKRASAPRSQANGSEYAKETPKLNAAAEDAGKRSSELKRRRQKPTLIKTAPPCGRHLKSGKAGARGMTTPAARR